MAVCTSCGGELPDDARFCPACGTPVARAPTGEERKLATVLFADLVGSTSLGGSQDPERTRATLERFYDAMAAEVAEAGGTLEKFVGDAVMAVFGAPAAQEDHAERALHAALAMRRRLAELFGDELELRFGVNTGEVVVGAPREGSAFVTGDPVNVAARLEQAARPGEILVGERTVAAARGAFEFDDPAVLEAKGKPGGVAGRRLVRALSLMRPRGLAGLRPAFVGRENELDLLRATYRRVANQGDAHLVTIMGDAGVGKTRLVRELWAWLAEQAPQPLQRTGRCLSYGRMTYWALGEALKEHLGLLETDPPEEALRRLGHREILGLALGLDVARDLHPLAARERLHDEWVAFLSELVSGRPTVVLIEDLHWAEEPLLDLLDRIVRDVHGPLLLLGTARPELLGRRPAWGGGRRNSSLVWLEALPAHESERMLDGLLATELPAGLREVIVGRAEGNPFFVEELLGAFIDLGVLERRNGGWVVREVPDGFTIPDSVQAILSARIDLLGPNEKAGLQAASVIGRIFWCGPVRELLGSAEVDCAALEDRDFVRRRVGSSMTGEEEYAFKHALTREVAYGSLTTARRAHLHARFADWLESFGGGRDEHAPLLAHHYAAAVRPEDADLAWAGKEQEHERLRAKARGWLRRSAGLAIGRYELEEGLAALRGALDLGPGEAEAAEIWRAFGHASALRYDGEAFWTAMQRSLELDPDPASRAETLSVLAFQTSIRTGMWRQRPDPELVDGWIEQALALSEPDSKQRARALAARAFARGVEGAEAAREASRLAERIDDVELRSFAMCARSAIAWEQLRFSESLTWAERRFELVGEVSDPDHLVEMYEAAVPGAAALGRLREARRLAEAHAARSRSLSTHHLVHGLSLVLEVGDAAADWGAIRELTPELEQAVAQNATTPCVRNARSLLLCAAASAAEGDDARARELERAAEEWGMDAHAVSLAAPRLRLALLRGDLDAVARNIEASALIRHTWGPGPIGVRLDALAALRDRVRVEQEAPAFLQPGTYVEPFALRALGVVREDEEPIRRALERFEEMKLTWHAEQTRALLAR